MKLKDNVYDVLKYIVLIVLPACGTLYMAVAGVWGLSHIEQVVGTLSAIGTFLGALICVSTAEYNKDIVTTGEKATRDEDDEQI